MTAAEFNARFTAIEPAPIADVAFSEEDWRWLDAYAADTGIASRTEAFEIVLYCAIELVHKIERELSDAHDRGEPAFDTPWLLAEAFASLPTPAIVTDPVTTMALTVDAPFQAKFGQFTDLQNQSSPAVAYRLFRAGQQAALDKAAQEQRGPMFASVFPEVETLDAADARAIVEAATDEVLERSVTTPAYATMTVFRARGYYLAIVEFDAAPERWYHPFYCAVATTEDAIMGFCAGHADACIETTGLEFTRS